MYYDNGQLRMGNNTATAYPNPADTEIVISGPVEDEAVRIEIYDPIGRRIEERNLTTRQLTDFAEQFDVRQWTPGFYYVKIFYSQGKTESMKVYRPK